MHVDSLNELVWGVYEPTNMEHLFLKVVPFVTIFIYRLYTILTITIMVISGQVRFCNIFNSDMSVKNSGLLRLELEVSQFFAQQTCIRLDDIVYRRLSKEICDRPSSLGSLNIAKPYARELNFQSFLKTYIFTCEVYKQYSEVKRRAEVVRPVVFDENGTALRSVPQISVETTLSAAVRAEPYTITLTPDLIIVGVSLRLSGIMFHPTQIH